MLAFPPVKVGSRILFLTLPKLASGRRLVCGQSVLWVASCLNLEVSLAAVSRPSEHEKRLSLLFCLIATAAIGRTGVAMTGVDSPSESAQVDQLFTEWDKPTSPGCALVIMRDGHIIYERGCGMADLDHNVKITPTTVFHVASMSKQFTAASVLMLAQEGKLSLDDEAINMCQSSQILGYRSHSAIQRSDRDLLSRMAQGN